MTNDTYRCGWVAIMGPPNAGKSTFLNAALGQKVAIVTPKAQTTRNRITGILTDKEAQVIFMDTPGIHHQRGKMNRVLTQTAWDAVQAADAVMVVLDADMYARRPECLDNDLKPLAGAVAAETRPVFIVANKVDLLGDKSRLLPLLKELHGMWPRAEIFPCSALTGDGLRSLMDAVKKTLPEAAAQFPEDQVSTLTVRFMATEIIREKLFLSLHQELPYSTTVDIEDWKEEPGRGITFINAAVYVARPSQKAIVIGKGGRNLKQVGQSARKEIAGLLETRVHLELWVKVREDWPEDPGFLRGLGLGGE